MSSEAPPVTSTSQLPVLMRLAPFVLMIFMGYLTIGIPLSAVTLYVGGDLGFSTVTVGWIIGIQAVATLLTRKFAADIVDSRGPRPSVISGLGVLLMAGLLMVASSLLRAMPGASLAVLAVARIALGIGESLMLTGTLTWGIGTVGPAHAGKVMTWNGVAMYGAIALGAPLGLLLLKRYGFLGVSLATVALPVIAFAASFMIRPIALHGGARLPFYKVVGRVAGPGIGLMLATVGFGTIGAFIALDYAQHGWDGAGYALIAFGASYIAMRLVFGGLPDRMGGVRAALIFLPIEVGGQMLLYAAHAPAMAIAGAALSGLGFSLVFPAFGIEAVKRVPPQNRGAAMGGYVAFFDIALGATAPVAGVVAHAWGYPMVFVLGALAAAASFVIAWRETALSTARAVPQPGTT